MRHSPQQKQRAEHYMQKREQEVNSDEHEEQRDMALRYARELSEKHRVTCTCEWLPKTLDFGITAASFVFSFVLVWVVNNMKSFLKGNIQFFTVLPVVLSFASGTSVKIMSHTMVALNEECFSTLSRKKTVWLSKMAFRVFLSMLVASAVGYFIVVYVMGLPESVALVMFFTMLFSSLMVTVVAVTVPLLLRSASLSAPLNYSPLYVLIANDIITLITFFYVSRYIAGKVNE